ncbi:mechanosensitive ion channel family protein [Candidatus Micrarchaeota archaeon]|nr:mechanosensitive ion channel family protein [Candidatus Micrarchaeota archaeon]
MAFSLSELIPEGNVLISLIVLIILVLGLNILLLIFLHFLNLIAGKTRTDLDDRLIKKAKNPLHIFVTLTAIYLTLSLSFPGLKFFGVDLERIYFISELIVAAIVVNRIPDVLILWYGKDIAPKTQTTIDDEVFPFVRNIIRVLIYLAFTIIILDNLGIEIAPLLAGLGIAGLAVALALQDSLSNFFAGIYIMADKPLREGEYISLDSAIAGQSVTGQVESIGWRSTKIRTIANNHIIVPNAKLAQSIVTNYYTPDEQIVMSGEVSVDYGSDTKKVEKTIYDAIKLIQSSNSNMIKNINPIVRFEKFGDYSLIFKYFYRINKYENQFDINNEINHSIVHAFRQNGITIPFPVRTVYNVEGIKKNKEYSNPHK